MASDAKALAEWQAYINNYEQKVAQVKQKVDAVLADPQSTDAEKKEIIDEYTYHSMYLRELKAKYNEYSTSGEPMPEFPTLFEGDETDPALIYKSNISGDLIHYGTIGSGFSGSGDLSHVDDEVPLGTLFNSDLLNISAKVVKTDYNASSQTEVSFSGPRQVQLQSGYDWYCDSNKNLDYWTKTQFNPSGISITMYDDLWSGSNARPLIRAYWGSISNPVSINQGGGFSCPITFTLLSMLTLPEGTVPKDEPWAYYNRVIKPRVPHSDVYPNGYDPGSEDEPPEEGKPDPDEKDTGTPPDWERVSELRATMTKFYVMTPTTYNQLRLLLAQTVQDSWNNPTDESKFMYLLGKLRKGAGTQPEYETAANNFIGEYLVGCKAYPFDLKTSKTYNNGNYTANQANTIAFGYNGAGLDVSSFTNPVYDLTDSIIESKTVAIDCPNREGTNSLKDCTFLDFEPFTTYSILLPYIGEFDLPARQVVCAHLTIVYTLDFTSGTVLAEVYTKGGYNTESEGYADTILLLKKTGVIGCSCSIAGNDIVKQGDQMVIASTAAKGTVVHTLVSDINANIPTEARTLKSVTEGESPIEGLANYAVSNITAKYDKILNMPNRVEEIFSNNQNMAMAGVNKTQASRDVPFILAQGTNISPFGDIGHPTLRIKKTRTFEPEGYGHMYGYPKQNTMKLGSLKGFFQTASIDVSGIGDRVGEPTPTEIEQKMINDALKSGSFMT